MSNPFKKGDIVRCVKPCLGGPLLRSEVVVEATIGDHDIRPVGFREAWLVGNFELVESAPFQVGDEVAWDSASSENRYFNTTENKRRKGKVTKVWKETKGHKSMQRWYIEVQENDPRRYSSSHYASRFKLINPKENNAVKQYTQEELTKEIIEYKSSASAAIRAKLIQLIATAINRTYGSNYGKTTPVPNDLVVEQIKALDGVCNEGKDKFIKHLQLVEDVKKPNKLYITICVEPGSVFDSSSDWVNVRDAYRKVHDAMRDVGLGNATWSNAGLGAPTDMVSTWSEIYDRGAGKKK